MNEYFLSENQCEGAKLCTFIIWLDVAHYHVKYRILFDMLKSKGVQW